MSLKSTLNEVCARYWICTGMKTVKVVIKDCVLCKYVTGKVMLGPNRPDLPSYRIFFKFAFSNVGIDYAGPLFVKDVQYQFNHHIVLLHIVCITIMSKYVLFMFDSLPTLFILSCIKLHQFLIQEDIKWTHILPKPHCGELFMKDSFV